MKNWPKWFKWGVIGLIIGLIWQLLKGGFFGLEMVLFQPSLLVPYLIVGILYGLIFGKRKPKKVKTHDSAESNEPYTSESNIAVFLTNQVAGANNPGPRALSFPIISDTEVINVRVYKDDEESLADYKTFDFDYTNKTNPLLEKELFSQLETALKVHGLTRSKENPQIAISMDFFIGKKEKYTPPTTITSTKLMYDWNVVSLGNAWGGMTSTIPITSSQTTPGYTTVTYYCNIRLNFLNHAKLIKGKKLEIPPMIWMGESDSEILSPDIRGAAPIMFNELIEQFLNPSYGSTTLSINHVFYGGLGLGFNTTDWHIINHIEKLSVAAEHGIGLGDYILAINGKPVGNWPTYNYPYGFINSNMNYPMLYRSTDPYFQGVLSNRGDKDVELVIRSAETGKKITFKMKPRTQERFVQSDPISSWHAPGVSSAANAVGIIIAIVGFTIFLALIL